MVPTRASRATRAQCVRFRVSAFFPFPAPSFVFLIIALFLFIIYFDSAGYRYKCLHCKNHDICETCHAKFCDTGELTQNESLARVNQVSKRAEDHKFRKYAESDGSFKPIGGGGVTGATKARPKKTKPNDPCPCGSKKKYKKCCR